MRQPATLIADYNKLTNIRPNIILIETSDNKNPAIANEPLGNRGNFCFLDYFINVFDKNNMKES